MTQAMPPHLVQLEAESIAIMRETVAEFKKPVMLYSIGKDSSVLLHLALKAFYPGRPPFPLLHIDTTWKFREMIAFRDDTARRLNLELLVHTNQDGLDRGIDPMASGSTLYMAHGGVLPERRSDIVACVYDRRGCRRAALLRIRK